MSKTNSGLIKYAEAQLGKPYWWGTFGQIASGSLYAAKKRQYPSYYKANDFQNQYGRRVHDCIGLIKGYLWSDSPSSVPTYVSSQDKSASGMYGASKVKGTISTFDYVPGRLIYKGSSPAKINHVGIYIGAGLLIEAKGHAYGVVKGAFRPSEWTYWSQCPFIQADVEKDGVAAEAQEYKAPAGGNIYGVDVSDVQYLQAMDMGHFLEENKGRISFVIIKCTRAASSVNACFKPWAEILTKLNIPWMGYHYLNNDERKAGANAEADYYIEQMRPYIGIAGMALDYEGEHHGFAVGTGYAKAWLDRVKEKTGVTPLIYTQQSAVHTLGDICRAGYPLWVARYGKNERRTDLIDPADIYVGDISPYEEAAVFQYSSNTILPGYAGVLDMNVFHGSEADFRDLCKPAAGVNRVDVSAKLPELKRGSIGKAVKVWQTIVGARADGNFGPATEVETKYFQRAHGLADDGIVGRKTWTAGMEAI